MFNRVLSLSSHFPKIFHICSIKVMEEFLPAFTKESHNTVPLSFILGEVHWVPSAFECVEKSFSLTNGLHNNMVHPGYSSARRDS